MAVPDHPGVAVTLAAPDEPAGGVDHYNRPGQPALRYRVGTHATFLARMLDRLTRQTIPDGPRAGTRPLDRLATREPDDPAIALLDAWSCVADVLTFYQERIANEGYLGTATERRSVLELARAIGYELNPGAAASAWLAFEIDDPPGLATVPEGAQVLSIPGQDEQPQTFETSEALEAREAWNEFEIAAPGLADPVIVPESGSIRLKTPDIPVRPGDLLAAIWPLPTDETAGSDAAGATVLESNATAASAPKEPPADASSSDDAADSTSGPRWCLYSVRSVTPGDDGETTNVTWARIAPEVAPVLEDPIPLPEIHAFHRRAALFGHDAPDWNSLPKSATTVIKHGPKLTDATVVEHPVSQEGFDGVGLTEWPGLNLPSTGKPPCSTEIDLDRVYPDVVPDGWLVLVNESPAPLDKKTKKPAWVGPRFALQEVDTVSTVARDEFLLHAKVTRVTVPAPGVDPGHFPLRATVVLAESGKLEPARVPQAPLFTCQQMELRKVRPPPAPGQRLLFETTTESGELRGEVAVVARVEDVAGHPDRMRVSLRESLEHEYDSGGVTIHGNVVRATHGETVEEVLGSGDAGRGHQRFTLGVPPLTHVAAPTGQGIDSTLAVRVNGVLWRQAPSLYGLDSRSQRYLVRIDDEGVATAVFGDGVQGARLPSGQENVAASYRSGLGPEGNVAADTLALLQTHPLGVRTVSNPLPATGGAARDDLGRARANAPRSVLTMGRAVSLEDYANLARVFPGIAKASARFLRGPGGEGRMVHVTVAATGAEREVKPDSALHDSLTGAFASLGDPAQPFRVDSFEELGFRVAITVRVDAAHRADTVLDAVRAALAAAFGFERREFGQPVAASEVVAVVQRVPGVIAADLDALHVVSGDGGAEDGASPLPGLASRLTAHPARVEGAKVEPAQMLVIDLGPDDIVAEEAAR